MSGFRSRLQANAHRIEEALSAFLPRDKQGFDHLLWESMGYSTLGGGKRLRGHLVLEFCSLWGGNPQHALHYAAGLEMIQAFSLIHDDLPCMDNDTLRRGKPTNHVVYGDATALLAGDALALYAPGVLAANPYCTPAQNLQAVQILAEKSGAKGMCGGQQIDLQSENKQIGRDELQELVAKKCGALFEAACAMGCIAAGGDGIAVERSKEFGLCVGIAFQIADDLLDLHADASVLGKTPGKDEQCGKSTFCSLLGEEGAKAYMLSLAAKAKELLYEFPSTEVTSSLEEFCDFIVDRSY